jgi:hypothetical protein
MNTDRVVGRGGIFLISLDFEIRWGVRDQPTVESYKPNLLGERRAVPAMLELFSEFGIHATWATVGFLFHGTRDNLLAALPSPLPAYADRNLSPYENLHEAGADERTDPYHYAPSLIKAIAATPHQEIGTHTYSHYYCLEDGQTVEAFEADLLFACEIAKRNGVKLESLVFPRNQFNSPYIRVCSQLGIKAFRGNESGWIYRAVNERTKQSTMRRALRLIDAYINISGHNCSTFERTRSSVPFDMPSSRFLRPYSKSLRRLEGLRLRRITSGLTYAARHNLIYHLWWHPHNFGVSLEANLAFLRQVLEHFASLRLSHGMKSLTMGELAHRLEKENLVEQGA